jgi:hypothetical protein
MSKIDLSHSEREMLREKLQRYCAPTTSTSNWNNSTPNSLSIS